MKKVTKIFGIFALSTLMAVSNPVAAQSTTDSPSSTTTSHDDDGDDNGKWGLAGLLGLVGLLGLRKKDDVRHTNTTLNR
jgi:MYXO-CTERM domain-containing protein